MQTNTPNDPSAEEINTIVMGCIKYLQENPYGAVTAEINGAPCTVVAAVESEEMQQVQPLFILPSPELILHVVNPETKETLFQITGGVLN